MRVQYVFVVGTRSFFYFDLWVVRLLIQSITTQIHGFPHVGPYGPQKSINRSNTKARKMSRAQTDGEERLGGLFRCVLSFSVQEQQRGTFWDMGVELKFLGLYTRIAIVASRLDIIPH